LGGQILKIANGLSRNLAATSGLLLLVAAGQLAGQTANTALTSNSLQFSHQQNSLTTPPAQSVRVFSAPSSLTYTASAVTNGGGTWLLVNGLTTASGVTGQLSQDLQISVNPAGLVAGTYTGTVSVNVAGAAANLIGVTLTVSTAPQVFLNPASLVITGQAGAASTAQVAVGSTGIQVPFSATVTATSPQGAWLSVSPASANSGSSVLIVANAAALPPTTSLAVGTVTFSSLTLNGGSVTLPVNFIIGAAATLVVNPLNTTIGFQLGTATPGSRQITVTSSGTTTLPYTAQVTSGTWLTLSQVPSSIPGTTVLNSTTGNPFYVVANPVGLGAGEYNGKVSVSSTSVGGSAQEVNVRLIISTNPLLQSTPENVAFNHTLGTAIPSGQLVSVTSTSGQPLQFTAQATTAKGGDWLIVSPNFGTTNQNTLLVQLNAARLGQLTADTYTGSVTITAPGAANSPLVIPVTLTVSGSTLIRATPAELSFNMQQGQTPAAQSFALTSSDASNQQFSIGIEPSGTNWLIVSPSFGSTGATGVLVSVNVNPNAITQPGNYEATIVVTPLNVTGSVPLRIPVKLTVIGSASVTANPTRLDFNQVGAAAPQAQTVTVNSTVSGVSFIASSNQPWITVTPAAGTIVTGGTPLTIGVNSTGLTPGTTYEGQVTVSVSGVTTLSIPVKFQFQNAAALAVSSNQLSFTFQTGSTNPAAQNLGLTSNGVPISFTAAATTTTGGSWLSLNPTTGTTAASGGAATNIAVSVNPAGLTPGTYNGTITLTSTNASNSPVTVPVTLVVSNPTPPLVASVQNAGSNAATSISPGLIIAIKGTNLGPTTGVGGQVVSGSVTTQLSDVRVLFDNIPAPILFARQDQVNAIAPYFLANRTSTRLVVEYKGVRSDPIDLRVVETAPGLFTTDGSGTGQGAILNQDNSVNSPNNPAARGSVVVLYATGEGQVIPAGTDGRVITANSLTRPFANVQVRIGGMPAEVLYAGAAPGLVSGALQVNVRVPQLTIAAPSPQQVELIIGNASSATTQNVSVTVRP
jgi:uncharacterized protein (TIGR03437 family)